MTGNHQGSSEFGGLLSQDGMSGTEVILLLGSNLVVVGVEFGSPGAFSGGEEHESVLVTLLEEGQVTDLATLNVSRRDCGL